MVTREGRFVYSALWSVISGSFTHKLMAIFFLYRWSGRKTWSWIHNAPLRVEDLGTHGPPGHGPGLFHYDVNRSQDEDGRCCNVTKLFAVCGTDVTIFEDWSTARNRSTVMGDASYMMARYFEKTWGCGKLPPAVGNTTEPQTPKVRVMELGSGIGFATQALAKMMPAIEMLHMTDYEYTGGNIYEKLAPHIGGRHNYTILPALVEKALHANKLEKRINTTQLKWDDSILLAEDPELYGVFDHILAADIIAPNFLIENMVRTLIRLSKQGTTVWVASRSLTQSSLGMQLLFSEPVEQLDLVGGWTRLRESAERYFTIEEIKWQEVLDLDEVDLIERGRGVVNGHFRPHYPPWRNFWSGWEWWEYDVGDLVFLKLTRNSKPVRKRDNFQDPWGGENPPDAPHGNNTEENEFEAEPEADEDGDSAFPDGHGIDGPSKSDLGHSLADNDGDEADDSQAKPANDEF